MDTAKNAHFPSTKGSFFIKFSSRVFLNVLNWPLEEAVPVSKETLYDEVPTFYEVSKNPKLFSGTPGNVQNLSGNLRKFKKS